MNFKNPHLYLFGIASILVLNACNSINKYNTPVTVRSTKDIGELISAEYHGEVYNSYSNYIYDTAFSHFENLFDFIQITYRKKLNGPDSSMYALKPALLLENDDVKKQEVQHMTDALGIESNNRLINAICSEEQTWEKFLALPSKKNNLNLEDHYVEKLRKSDKKFKKTNVSYIGRGSVKAGYDLENYNFDINSEIKGDSLILRNLEARILNFDINPWYSDNGKIKGFEIIDLKKEKFLTFEDIKKVKIACRQKLLAEAFELNILEAATESGIEHLQNLYALLNVNSQNPIQTVLITAPQLFEEKVFWLKDAIIDTADARRIFKNHELYSAENPDLKGFNSIADKVKYWEETLQQLDEHTIPEKNCMLWKAFRKEM